MMTNSIYNGWRFEDVWLDQVGVPRGRAIEWRGPSDEVVLIGNASILLAQCVLR